MFILYLFCLFKDEDREDTAKIQAEQKLDAVSLAKEKIEKKLKGLI